MRTRSKPGADLGPDLRGGVLRKINDDNAVNGTQSLIIWNIVCFKNLGLIFLVKMCCAVSIMVKLYTLHDVLILCIQMVMVLLEYKTTSTVTKGSSITQQNPACEIRCLQISQ